MPFSRALVPWAPGWAVEVVPGLEVPDDPPHAVSSRISEPSPAAAASPLLRITTLHSRFSVPWVPPGFIGSWKMQPRSQYAGNVPERRPGRRLLSRYLVIWGHTGLIRSQSQA